MIREDLFVSKMTAHWKSLGNCPSRKLQSVWQQLCFTFNEQSTATDTKWRVIQPATGTGKSQGLALYSAMHRDQSEVGILIVVRLISQAEEMTTLINRLAGKQIANDHHNQNHLSTAEMAQTQVLVVTHRAYELSLDKYSQGCEQKFSSFMTYDHCFGGQRELVVIDECLDIVKQYQVTLSDLLFALGAMPYEIQQDPRFTVQFELLNSLKQTLVVLTSETTSDQMVTTEAQHLPDGLSFRQLRDVCNQLPWDKLLLNTECQKDRLRLCSKIDRTLEASQATLEQWHFYSRKGKRHTLNTSALVLPDDIKGAVILDATASQNLLYQLFADKVEIKPVIEARSYRNVTIHVAEVSGIGKGSMTKQAKSRTTDLINDLSQRLPPHAKTFICSHKDVECHVALYETPFEMKTGHWGAIDGRNDFQDCDTFVCFGLPYRDRVMASNMYFAIKGPQESEWLQHSSKRADHGYTDIRQAIEEGLVTADVIQAINRIRVRRVVDEDGNCELANCYILLGRNASGIRLLDSIRKAMPGIKVKEWALSMDEKAKLTERPKNYHRSRYAEGLIKYLEGRLPGQWSAKQLRAALDIPATRWKALCKELKIKDSPLFRKLSDIGCQLMIEGIRGGARTYIIKEG
jgi:hypothetical protein